MLTRLDQLETGHTIRLPIFTFLASKKHILDSFLLIFIYLYLAIKYQYTLYTLNASNSISFKIFLPKKKHFIYIL